MCADRRERVAVVGTGAAGLRAAERLRELGFDGELVIVGEEPYRPYHRPALTKQLLTGEVRPKDIMLPVLTELDAIWRYGTRASWLEPDEHLLHLPGGEEIRYDGLIIATGSQARHLPGAPRQDPRVRVLRTLPDAVHTQKAIQHSPRGRIAVIGGGFIGCEIASAARALGRDATIIVPGRTLMEKVPGAGFGDAVATLHQGAGVEVLTEAHVAHWVPRPDGVALHLNTGQVVVAACVVLGIGTVPATDWLRGSGLILDDGIMCDPTCHAVGASDIVVAGDVARWPNLLFDSVPRRVEHWYNAIEMGRAAAANLLAGRESAVPYTPLPRFWSDQHGIRIQAAGTPALAQETVPLAGSVKVGHRVTGYVSGGSLIGIVAWDSPRGMLRWTEELDRQLTVAMRRRAVQRPQRMASLPETMNELTMADLSLAPVPPESANEVTMSGLSVPDFVPDMDSLSPAELSVPNLYPVRLRPPGMPPPRPDLTEIRPLAPIPPIDATQAIPAQQPIDATQAMPSQTPLVRDLFR
jgi:NADPH-dependent 2,4-dienoyl-CoA reductase/sulfur reductase-like enzyme